MKTEILHIGDIPAVLYGPAAERVFLFVHGQMGCKEEAGDFAAAAVPAGWQVLGIDLPGHGERAAEMARFVPWEVVPELQTIMAWVRERWATAALRCNSIGAWFSMLAFPEEPLDRCLFVSPVVDMSRLIEDMMGWAGVTPEQLEAAGEIETAFGQTLSWAYRTWAGEHPVTRWEHPTAVLYGTADHMTARPTVDDFVRRTGARLTVLAVGEHWFHTPEQLAVLRDWERTALMAGDGNMV